MARKKSTSRLFVREYRSGPMPTQQSAPTGHPEKTGGYSTWASRSAVFARRRPLINSRCFKSWTTN